VAIVDGRTLISNANAQGSWVDDAGGTMGATAASNNFIVGTGSIEGRSSKSTNAIQWDFGSPQDFTDTVFYIWCNMSAAALLDLKANQGLTMRFSGATQTDWFEINVAGSDTYGGGWKMFVVDASVAKTASDNTNGTPPAVTAVQFVGISVTTTATAPGSDPNFFIDASWHVAVGTPGIRVEGQNAAAAWTMADILAAAVSTGTDAPWGMLAELDNGTLTCNAHIRFGADDATQDEFADTNIILGFEVADVVDGFFGFDGVAGAGQMDVTFGIKTGTGNDATGAQGFVITSGGPRWFMDFSTDADIDSAGFYGCQFVVGEIFDLDSVSCDLATVVFNDCDKAHFSNAKVVRATVVAATTADGVAFCDTDDLGDIANSSFEFSDGHGIEILTGGPASQNNVGNIFSGAYGGTPGDNNTPASGSNDAMIYNNSAAAKTFNRSGGGTQPSFRNGASATSDDVAAINLTFTPLIANSEVRLYETGTNVEIDGVENSGTSFVASAGASQALDYKIINPGYLEINIKNVSFASSQNIIVNQQIDRNFAEDAA
jgi:hypothetical protein